MIQGMIQSLSTACSLPVPTTSGVHDKGFISILKTSIHSAGNPVNDDSATPAQNTALKSAAGAKDNSVSKDATDIKDTPVSSNPLDPRNKIEEQKAQDPVSVLRQLVLQMSAITQQVVNQLTLKDVSAAQASQGNQATQTVQATQALQAALMSTIPDPSKEAAQAPLLVQNVSGSATTAQGETFLASLAGIQDNIPDKIDFKLSDKSLANSRDALLAAMKDTSQNASLNVASPIANPTKTEAELQAFSQVGKDAAFLSKASGSTDDVVSRFTIESGAGQAVSETSGDKQDIPGASEIYAQGVQSQTSSVHEQSSVQEPVPANRMSSLGEVISKAVDSGQKNLVIRIDPPDLGSMHIRLSMDNGVLKADVRVDSSAIKDSLNLALPQIKTSLENAGIKVSEFSVDVRDQERKGQERNNQGQQQRQGRELKNTFSDFFA